MLRQGAPRSIAPVTPSLIYAPDLGAEGSVLELSREEAHYVARVCRVLPGDFVEATDGRGAIARLRVSSLGASVRAEVVSVGRAGRRHDTRLLCGPPERGRADWMVEKLAELGVTVVQPLDCDRDTWRAGAAQMERWKRLAVAALRQSRRAFLLEVMRPVALDDALAAIERPAACWVADPLGAPAARQERHPGPEVGAIGPSAGFRAEELKRLEAAGFVAVRLADGRLRTETAAISMAAWWAASPEGP